MRASCFTHRVRKTQVPKGFKLPHDQQKYDGSQEPESWLSDYLQAVKILGGLQSNSYAKFAATPHRCNAILVEQVIQRVHWKLEQARKAVYEQFQINLHTTSINRGTQSLHAEKWRITTLIYTALEHNKTQQRTFLRSEQSIPLYSGSAVQTSLRR
jgi:hypothetical protein